MAAVRTDPAALLRRYVGLGAVAVALSVGVHAVSGRHQPLLGDEGGAAERLEHVEPIRDDSRSKRISPGPGILEVQDSVVGSELGAIVLGGS